MVPSRTRWPLVAPGVGGAAVDGVLGIFCGDDGGEVDGGGKRSIISVTGSEVWAWGWNEHGNLGNGDTQNLTTPAKIWDQFDRISGSSRMSEGGRVMGVWAGCGTSWIITE